MTDTAMNMASSPEEWACKSQESSVTKTNSVRNEANVHYLLQRPHAVPPSFPIPKTPAEVINLVREAAKAFADDPAAIAELVEGTTKLMREIAPHGRPSGSSPPLEAPDWLEHKAAYESQGKSAIDFVLDHYSKYFGKGFTRAALRQQPQLYIDAVNKLRTHPMPAELAPYFLTKKQINDNRLAALGGRVSVETVPDPYERHRLAVAAHERRYG